MPGCKCITGAMQDAIKKVRQRRCKAAIETAKQEDFVCRYAALCQSLDVQKPCEPALTPAHVAPL